MARENTIKVSDKEKELLDRARESMYGTDEVPYGKIVEDLSVTYLNQVNGC